jgi:hypothetical protein
LSSVRQQAATACNVASISPRKYIDIGFPGFFAGRTYVELPVDKNKSICLKLDKADLHDFRTTIDKEIGRNFAHLLQPKLSSHRKMILGGTVLAILGLVGFVGVLQSDDPGSGIIVTFGLALAGAMMIGRSFSQVSRIKANMASGTNRKPKSNK